MNPHNSKLNNLDVVAVPATIFSSYKVCTSYQISLTRKFLHNRELFVIILLLCLPITTTLFSQATSEGYSESYLLRPVGARVAGLGGAYSGISNDANTLFFNPAGLSTMPKSGMIATTYSTLSFGRMQNSLAFAMSASDDFSFGIGATTLLSGRFTMRSPSGQSLGTATNWHYALVAGMSYSLPQMSIGITGKYLVNQLTNEGTNANGFGADIGVRMPIGNVMTFGASLQNIGSMNWNTAQAQSESLPWIIRSGVSAEIPFSSQEITTRTTTLGEEEKVSIPAAQYALISVDALYIRGSISPTIVLGSEIVPSPSLSFRGGLSVAGDAMGKFQLLPGTIYSVGASWRLSSVDLPFTAQLDYAITNDFTVLNSMIHHLSILVEL